jgi:hypothetical protein
MAFCNPAPPGVRVYRCEGLPMNGWGDQNNSHLVSPIFFLLSGVGSGAGAYRNNITFKNRNENKIKVRRLDFAKNSSKTFFYLFFLISNILFIWAGLPRGQRDFFKKNLQRLLLRLFT